MNRAWRVEQDFLGSLEDRKGTRRRISVASPPAQKLFIELFVNEFARIDRKLIQRSEKKLLRIKSIFVHRYKLLT